MADSRDGSSRGAAAAGGMTATRRRHEAPKQQQDSARLTCAPRSKRVIDVIAFTRRAAAISGISAENDNPRASSMLSTHALDCRRGERLLFTGLSFELAAGECLHLAGENGAGKTSLLRILAGLSPPAAGEVRWNGEPVAQLAETWAQQFIYIGHANGVKDDLSVAENLAFTLQLAGGRLDEMAIDTALEQVGLGGRGAALVRHLSQGQRRRAALDGARRRSAVDPRRTVHRA
jgi:heme ABC exporter ATP-binding subunit CcmA